MMKVLWDAGHGGIDLGASANRIAEKDIALAVAAEAHRLCVATFGETVGSYMTRVDDSDPKLYLSERGAIAKALGADLSIHIHCNSSPDPRTQGLTTFFLPGVAESKDLATAIARGAPQPLYRSPPLAIEGRSGVPWLAHARNVLLCCDAPCVNVLVEMGFLTNAADRLALTNRQVQQSMAITLVGAVSRWLELRLGENVA